MDSYIQEVLLRFIRSHEERQRIVKACHIDATSGHMGVKKSINRITERFMWPGVVKDVKNLVCF